MSTDSGVVIGRDRPKEVMRELVLAARQGRGQVALLVGEPGIGKSTLLREVAREASAEGATVLMSWCREHVAGWRAWQRLLRQLRRCTSEAVWRQVQSAAGPVLGTLLDPPDDHDPAGGPILGPDGFDLEEAVVAAFEVASEHSPLVVVLDDLHWADASALGLFDSLARYAWQSPILLIGAFRDTPAVDTSLGSRLEMLSGSATTVPLNGLSPQETSAIVHRLLGRAPESAMVQDIHRKTGGNPFFIEQVTRLVLSGGTLESTPRLVDKVVRARTDLLPSAVTAVLREAAVIGISFDRRLLVEVSGLTGSRLDYLLAEAESAGLLRRASSTKYEFIHDLVRSVLYQSLDESAREIHARIAGLTRSAHLAETLQPGQHAWHAVQAADRLDAGTASEIFAAAARSAASMGPALAAVEYYELALAHVTDERARTMLLTGLASVLQWHGDTDAALSHLRTAGQIARSLDDADLTARIALTLHNLDAQTGRRSTVSTSTLEEAYAALAPEDEQQIPAQDLPGVVTDLVTQRARTRDDLEGLTFGLWARHDSIWGPGTAQERRQILTELAGIASRTNDPVLEASVRSMVWVTALELGDSTFLRQWHPRGREKAGPQADLADQAVIAVFRGQLDEVDRLLDAVGPEADQAGGNELALTHTRWSAHQLRGQYEQCRTLETRLSTLGHPQVWMLQAVTSLAEGDPGPALSHLSQDLDIPQVFLPQYYRVLAETAIATGDGDLCAKAREALDPLRGGILVALYGGHICGPVDYWWAGLTARAGNTAQALEDYARAARTAQGLLAGPWALAARLASAQLAADRDTVTGLIQRARDHDWAGLTTHLARSGAATQAPATIFRPVASGWLIGAAGAPSELPRLKGLQDIHTLLRHPGTPIPSSHLRAGSADVEVNQAGLAGGVEMLDETARREFATHISRLDEQIAAALAVGRDEAAARLDEERQAVLDHLARATGLAGRTRVIGDEAEKARKTVSARIRDACRKIAEHDPCLARHLEAHLELGVTCRYRPSERYTFAV